MQLPTVTEFFGLSKKESTTTKSKSPFDPSTLGPKEVIMTWEAPSRWSSKGMSGRFSRTMLIITVFLGLFLVIMQEFFLLLLIASMVFVYQMISKTAPDVVTIEISNHGLKYDTTLYYWHQLKNFFFLDNVGNALAIDTRNTLPDRLFVLFALKDKKKIKEILEKQIDYIPQEPKTSMTKAYEAILNKLNLD